MANSESCCIDESHGPKIDSARQRPPSNRLRPTNFKMQNNRPEPADAKHDDASFTVTSKKDQNKRTCFDYCTGRASEDSELVIQRK